MKADIFIQLLWLLIWLLWAPRCSDREEHRREVYASFQSLISCVELVGCRVGPPQHSSPQSRLIWNSFPVHAHPPDWSSSSVTAAVFCVWMLEELPLCPSGDSFIDLRCQRRSLSLYRPHTCTEVKAGAHSITRCSEYLPSSNWGHHPGFSTKSSLREFAESSQILSSFLAKGHLGFGSRSLKTRRKPWNCSFFSIFCLTFRIKS